ncbi:MAG: RNA polymerase sigma factor [Bacteroidales bacterium]|jgi:RNA polymerase sigma-70 factor (ECF subfamily)|nr:RNA polymerase sigma factor [Bacteroidales bacterium]
MDQDKLLQIIKLSQNKDQKAFKKLVEHYQSYTFSLAFKLVCNEDDAKDIVQECFIRVWHHLRKFDLKTKFTTWLYKIVFNLSLDKIKVNKRRNNVLSVSENTAVLFEKLGGENLEKEVMNKDLAQIISSLAEELTPKQKAVFVLRDLQGAEIDEISEITSMSKGTVKSNLYYARLNIREKLEKIGNIKIKQHELR